MCDNKENIDPNPTVLALDVSRDEVLAMFPDHEVDYEISMDTEEELGDSDTDSEDENWRTAKCATDIDIVYKPLSEYYPDEDFTSSNYHGIELHKYLSSDVHRKEFQLMYNQWGMMSVYRIPKYRGRIAVHVREGKIFCLDCVKMTDGYNLGKFSQGYVKYSCTNREEFSKLVANEPDSFFCTKCEMCIIHTPTYEPDNTWEVPFEIVNDWWVECSYLVVSNTMDGGQEDNYVNIYVKTLYADQEEHADLSFFCKCDADYDEYCCCDALRSYVYWGR
uniref:NS3 n=1 Tax=uncultured densovirus TaxID=748192 RepID=A0A7L7YTG8_9VIRU|nr:NS3 [uncultured densovirus]